MKQIFLVLIAGHFGSVDGVMTLMEKHIHDD
jgi:hypothetical protein